MNSVLKPFTLACLAGLVRTTDVRDLRRGHPDVVHLLEQRGDVVVDGVAHLLPGRDQLMPPFVDIGPAGVGQAVRNDGPRPRRAPAPRPASQAAPSSAVNHRSTDASQLQSA
jgi:hypothetical protein